MKSVVLTSTNGGGGGGGGGRGGPIVSTFVGMSGTRFAGRSKPVIGSADGVGSAASFSYPAGLAFDSVTGHLFVCDFGNKKIRKIASSGEVSTFVGSGKPDLKDGAGTNAAFNCPTGCGSFVANTQYLSWGRRIAYIGLCAVVLLFQCLIAIEIYWLRTSGTTQFGVSLPPVSSVQSTSIYLHPVVNRYSSPDRLLSPSMIRVRCMSQTAYCVISKRSLPATENSSRLQDQTRRAVRTELERRQRLWYRLPSFGIHEISAFTYQM